MLWLVYFESANYAGYGSNVVVEASSAEAAEEAAQAYADAHYYEEDREQYIEENGEGSDEDDVMWASIVRVEKFDESHDEWKYFKAPSQKEFYPTI